MTIEKSNNSLDWRGDPQQRFEEDLVLPAKTFEEITAFSAIVAAADMLTALRKGYFYISETDNHDPDGVRVRYIGDREFTDFASLAYTFTQEVDRCKDVVEAARIAELAHPKLQPKNQKL